MILITFSSLFLLFLDICSPSEFYEAGSCVAVPQGFYRPNIAYSRIYYACPPGTGSLYGISTCSPCPSSYPTTIIGVDCLGIPSSQPSSRPTMQPSRQPSNRPSSQPSIQPSIQPTNQPTVQPSRQPSRQPTQQPTSRPSSVVSCSAGAVVSGSTCSLIPAGKLCLCDTVIAACSLALIMSFSRLCCMLF